VTIIVNKTGDINRSMGRIKRPFCVCLTLCLFVTSSCSAENSLEPDASSKSVRLQVQGRQIVDGNGNSVTLRGIYTRAEWLNSEQEVKWFKEWGVTFVRMLLTYDKDYWDVVNNGEVDLNKRCILREENLQEMDRKCKWLEKNKIYFIIEFPWRWYGIGQEFKDVDLLSKQCARLYATLAERYKDYNYLVGYCMFSEIYVAPWYYQHYKKVCTEIVDAVRKVDPKRILSVTGVQVSGVDSFKDETHIDRPGIIYDFHYYWVKSFTHYRPWYGDMRYPGRIPHGYSGHSFYQDRAFHESMIEQGLAYSRKWNAPLWCGEYGAFGNAPDGSTNRWIRDVCQIIENNNIPWIIWTWKKDLTDVPELWKELWRGESNYRVTTSPHGGTFTDPVSVKLETWVEGGEIRYTTDGSEPKASSSLYTALLRIEKDTTIRARVFKENINNAPIDTAIFKIGGRKPDEPEGKLLKGLQYMLFSGAIKKIEDDKIELMPVLENGTCKNLKSVSDNNTMRLNGFIKINKAGRYFFYPKSFGAYEIYIGDKLLSKHNATKYEWDRICAGTMALEAGMHKIKINYSRPAGISGGFSMKIQRDCEPINEPVKLMDSMLYHCKNNSIED